MSRLLSAAAIVGLAWFAEATQPPALRRPPVLPYEDRGLCPFECCTYRQWTVKADTAVYVDRTSKASVLYRLKPGDSARALTGIVVTTKLGKAVVHEPTTIGERGLPVVPGDTVYIINYVGEGYWKFWVNGEIDQEQFAGIGQQCAFKEPVGGLRADNPTGCPIQIESEPTTVWWAKVKNKRGQVGWTRDVDHFGELDACG